jgi:hypothetical protein
MLPAAFLEMNQNQIRRPEFKRCILARDGEWMRFGGEHQQGRGEYNEHVTVADATLAAARSARVEVGAALGRHQ